MIAPRVLYVGDPAIASRWVGAAKQFAQETYRSGIGEKVIRVATGVQLRVRNIFPYHTGAGVYGGVSKVWIDAVPGDTFFLESAFLDVQPLTPYFEPKTAATVYLTDAVETATAQTPTYLDTIRMPGLQQKAKDCRTYENGMDSLSVDSSLEEDDPDDFVNGAFVRKPTSDKRYGVLNNIYVSHCATNTGKMKLWGQCRMGIKYTDPVLIGTIIDAGEYKYLDGFLFFNQTQAWSHGLFTTQDYKYYYIRLINGVVTARYCKHDKDVSSLIKLLISGVHPTEDRDLTKEERYKVESYVLAYTTLDFFPSDPPYDEYQLNESAFTIEGTPLAYGWKFNWNGNKLSIVTLENLDETPSRVTARLYTITIEEGTRKEGEMSKDIAAPVSATLELVEEILCTPRSSVDIAWVPDPFFPGVMSYFYFFSCGQMPYLTHSTYVYDTDAPIYCWYGSAETPANDYYDGADEELITVRFTLGLESSPPVSGVPDYCGPTLTVEGTVISGSGTWSVERGGFYIDPYESPSTDLCGTVSSITDYRWDVDEGNTVRLKLAPHLSGISNPCVRNRPTSNDPGDSGVNVDRSGVVGTAYRNAWTGNKTYYSALIVPWDSAESIYFTKGVGTYKSSRTQDDYVFNGGNNDTGMSCYCINQPAYYEFSQISFGLTLAWYAPTGGYHEVRTGAYNELNINHKIYFKNGKIDLYDEDYAWGTTVYKKYKNITTILDQWTLVEDKPDPVGAYDDVFYPVPCGADPYPVLDSCYFNLESILGTKAYRNAEPYFGTDDETLVSDGNLPEDAADFNALYVGWV